MLGIWLPIGLYTVYGVITILWFTVASHRLGKTVPVWLKVFFSMGVLGLIYWIVQGAIATVG